MQCVFFKFVFIQIISSIVDTVYTWHSFETLTHKVLLPTIILAFLWLRLMEREVTGQRVFGSQNLMVLMKVFGLNHESSEQKGHHMMHLHASPWPFQESWLPGFLLVLVSGNDAHAWLLSKESQFELKTLISAL